MKKILGILIVFFIAINFMGCSAVMPDKREANTSASQIEDTKNKEYKLFYDALYKVK